MAMGPANVDRSRLSRRAGRVSGGIMAQETVKHYVFVDFENVQAVKLELIRGPQTAVNHQQTGKQEGVGGHGRNLWTGISAQDEC